MERHSVGQLRRGDHRSNKRDHGWRCRGNYTIVRTFTATDDAGNSSRHPDHHVQDTTAPEFTFVPADYTSNAQTRCRWKTPRRRQLRRGDDRSVARRPQATLRQLHHRRTFTATDDAGNSSSATQTITVQDTTAPEFTFVPADYTVECSDEMPLEDATARQLRRGDHRSVQRDDRRRCCRQLHHRSHVHGDRRCWKQQSAAQTITVQDTTAPSSPSSSPTHGRMLRRDAHGRRHGVGQLRRGRSKCPARRPQAMRGATTPSFARSRRQTMLQQQLVCYPDHHGPGHHRA